MSAPISTKTEIVYLLFSGTLHIPEDASPSAHHGPMRVAVLMRRHGWGLVAVAEAHRAAPGNARHRRARPDARHDAFLPGGPVPAAALESRGDTPICACALDAWQPFGARRLLTHTRRVPLAAHARSAQLAAGPPWIPRRVHPRGTVPPVPLFPLARTREPALLSLI
jgi:hypothetical protein